MNELYEMKLHDKIRLGKGVEIMRVPGGWVYTRFKFEAFDNFLDPACIVFVPYNDEFQWSDDGHNPGR